MIVVLLSLFLALITGRAGAPILEEGVLTPKRVDEGTESASNPKATNTTVSAWSQQSTQVVGVARMRAIIHSALSGK